VLRELGDGASKEVRSVERWLHVLYERWGRPDDAARYPVDPALE
jgi:hypothetical protein